jgi:hypothetical protein
MAKRDFLPKTQDGHLKWHDNLKATVTATTPGYTDTQPFRAALVTWTYRAIYRVGDNQWASGVCPSASPCLRENEQVKKFPQNLNQQK